MRLADGTLAGSVVTMEASVRNLVAIGVPVGLAVRTATGNPARVLGLADRGGSPPDVAPISSGSTPSTSVCGHGGRAPIRPAREHRADDHQCHTGERQRGDVLVAEHDAGDHRDDRDEVDGDRATRRADAHRAARPSR